MEDVEPKNLFDIDDDDGGIFKSLEKGIDETINLDKKEEWEIILKSLVRQEEAFEKNLK